MDEYNEEPVALPLFEQQQYDAVLLCPGCHGDHVHVDDVYMGGRAREDGDIAVVHVDHRGVIRDGHDVDIPLGQRGLGRRHTAVLQGWCEVCKLRFAIAFEQRKGQTLVQVLRQEWGTVLEGEWNPRPSPVE